MNRLISPIAMLLAGALWLAACAPAAAPAAPASMSEPAEAVPAAAATEAAAEAVGGDVEAPPVVPADTAAEATAQPATSGTRVFKIVADQSQAGYSVKEEFLGQGFETTVGTTNAINGQITLQFESNTVTLAENKITVDISTLKTDRLRRDQAIRDRWLESAKYPIATFVASNITALPADAALGKDVTFKVNGDLTVREVTQPVIWDMTAKVDGDTLSGKATTFIMMKDFGFDPPDIAGMLRVTDGVSVTVDFVAQEVK